MFTLSTQSPVACAHPAVAEPRLLGRLLQINALVRSRRALAQLSPEQLEDVGLTRAEAKQEANRRFWDVPTLWKR